MTRPTLTGLNFLEFNYYPFLVNLDKCSRSGNDADDLSTKKCVLSETKHFNYSILYLV